MKERVNPDILTDPDIHCPEAQEVMGRIPSAIVRWGMTLMAVIVSGMVVAACFLDWPETEECPCRIHIDNMQCIVTVDLSQKVSSMLIKEKSAQFSVEAPFLGESAVLRGRIGIQDVAEGHRGKLIATVLIPYHIDHSIQDLRFNSFEGIAVFIISDKKLIFHLFPSLLKAFSL